MLKERVQVRLLAVVSSECAYLRLPDEAMTKLANRAQPRCMYYSILCRLLRCKIEAMISKFSRALSQRCENGLTCSAYKCVYGQLQSRAPSTLLGLLPPMLLIPHATRPSLRRSVCLRMGGRNSEERVRQARRQVTIRSTMKALKYPETEERRLLFRWDDSAVRSVVLWKRNPTLRNTDMTLKNTDNNM